MLFQTEKEHSSVLLELILKRNKKEIVVVYHLHGKTGWSTVCSNGKRKSPMQNFDQDWRVPFAQPLLNDT